MNVSFTELYRRNRLQYVHAICALLKSGINRAISHGFWLIRSFARSLVRSLGRLSTFVFFISMNLVNVNACGALYDKKRSPTIHFAFN